MTQEQTNKISKLSYGLILLAVICWVIATIMPAYLQAQGQVIPAFLIRKIFSPICHQMVERSFWFLGYPLAVCARCSGIYFGVLLGTLFYPVIKNYQQSSLPPRSYLIVMLLPTTIDFLLGTFHILENTHFSRAFTGVLAGFGLAFYIIPATINLSLELSKFIANKGVIFYGSK